MVDLPFCRLNYRSAADCVKTAFGEGHPESGTMRKRGSRGVRPASLRICVTCRWRALDVMPDGDDLPGKRLHDIACAIASPAERERIHPIVCLTHCPDACNAVAMQRGKPPLLMTRMSPDHDTARALLDTLQVYDQSPDGAVSGSAVETRPLVPGGARRRT